MNHTCLVISSSYVVLLTHLGDSMSGTCRKLELLGLCEGLCRVGTALARMSATDTWGEPKPVLKPYSISWNTLGRHTGNRRSQVGNGAGNGNGNANRMNTRRAARRRE